MKPKGGRGKKAPYQTKQMRVPVPVELQVMQLCDRYREFIEAGGNPEAPPPMLESRLLREPGDRNRKRHHRCWSLARDCSRVKLGDRN